MKKVLVVSGHPDIDGSIANRTALEEYEKRIPGVEIDRLDVLYPDYRIDVKAEQEKLRKADIIVLQYPLFWYAMPALMQKWLEDVLLDGFAYGDNGDALHGKEILSAITIGTPAVEYGTSVPVLIDQLTIPMESTAIYTGMNFLGQEWVDDVSNIPSLDDETVKDIQDKARKLADRVIERVTR